jgi:hypothetical protein
LFIAEAPPLKDDRYFYFEDQYCGDTFYLEIMNALYGKTRLRPACLRKYKVEFLQRFRGDGFYLIDACEMPLEETNRKYKEKIIEHNLPDLVKRINHIRGKDTKIILILATVYRVCLEPLRLKGLNVINTESIPLPGFGQQKRFRERITRLLSEKCNYTISATDWMPKDCL